MPVLPALVNPNLDKPEQASKDDTEQQIEGENLNPPSFSHKFCETGIKMHVKIGAS